MLSKNEVKYIQSLCHKKQRQADSVFVVEGPKPVEEVLAADFKIKKIYAVPEWADKNADLTNVITITEDELQRISNQQSPNKVLAVVEQPILTGAPVFKGNITLVLDGIQDPGNMGTIIRIADWFGINQIICSKDTVELYNPKVIQSTMGSFSRVKLWYTDLKETLAGAEVPVFGALLNGSGIYDQPKIKEGVLIIGNEGKGIREDVLKLITNPITIPKMGGAESLNAAVATGIIVAYLVGRA
ncbi:TrmH family RNA methyltransferase [Chitinophagaceae bacterium LWZ2-11]